MTIEEICIAKNELGLSNVMLSKASGVPVSTVQKVITGETKKPRRATIVALAKAIEAERASFSRETRFVDYSVLSSRESVQEAMPRYDENGRINGHTIEEHKALPDDVHTELIDGVFYDVPPVSMEHQAVLGELYVRFRECIGNNALPWHVILSPAVRLDRDEYTLVQPDLMVFCHHYNPEMEQYEGAPDLIAEVLSPATCYRDAGLKLYKYYRAGVREYWIVDPVHRNVTVHCFERSEYDPKRFSFGEGIPVQISGGKYEMDLSGANV